MSISRKLIESVADAIDDLDIFDPKIVNFENLAYQIVNYMEDKGLENLFPYEIGQELMYLVFNPRLREGHHLEYMFGRNSDEHFEDIGNDIISPYYDLYGTSNEDDVEATHVDEDDNDLDQLLIIQDKKKRKKKD